MKQIFEKLFVEHTKLLQSFQVSSNSLCSEQGFGEIVLEERTHFYQPIVFLRFVRFGELKTEDKMFETTLLRTNFANDHKQKK